MAYLWKEECSRTSKMIFPWVKRANTKNTNTQIHKYTNTQTQHMTKCQKDPKFGRFLKRGLFKDIKNYIPMCQKRKYKNMNTQIRKYSIWRSSRNTEHVVYIWKEVCSGKYKIIFPCVKWANTKNTNTKYKNTAKIKYCWPHIHPSQTGPSASRFGIFLMRESFSTSRSPITLFLSEMSPFEFFVMSSSKSSSSGPHGPERKIQFRLTGFYSCI